MLKRYLVENEKLFSYNLLQLFPRAEKNTNCVLTRRTEYCRPLLVLF